MRTLLTLLLLLSLASCKKEQTAQQQAPEVPVVPVMQKDIRITQDFIGQTYGGSDIEIRARVQGWVASKHFTEGSEVKKGQLLYIIDPLPYQTQVDVAKGQLAETEAQLTKAKSDLDRIRPLAQINAVSQRDLVAAEGQYQAAVARKQAYQANLGNANIELSYTRILSPIDGTIGLSKAQVGDYVGGINIMVLNTVSSINSIRARFSISEREYLEIRKKVLAGEEINREVQLILTDGSLHPQKGLLNFANREIDPTTGTLTLEASFPNPQKILRPGQFARVRVVMAILKGAMLVPQRAVTELQGSFQVFVVDKENKIQTKVVQAGERYGENWIITSGLTSTDQVAILGSLFIRANSQVTPVSITEIKNP